MIRFSIFGIPVRVDPWFWITMAFIGSGMAGNRQDWFVLLLVFIFAAFLSILIHELGHALMIRKYGLSTAITLQAFGGFATYPAGHLNRKQSFLVTAAGPAVQFAFGVSLIVLSRFLIIPVGSLFLTFLDYLVGVSILWSILNCLPVYPLDGGQMLAAVMGPGKQHHVHLIGVIAAVSIGLIAYFRFGATFLALFMALFAWQNWQGYQATSR